MAAAPGTGPAPVTGADPAPAPAREPLRRLTVLYDPDCSLCAHIRGWFPRQRQLVPVELLPVGSGSARQRFPALDHEATQREITVIGDSGQVYRGDTAWVVCLWALADHRALSHLLATPAGRRLARAAVLTAAKYRESSKRSGPAGARGPGPRGVSPGQPAARGTTYGIAPGWTYDTATGWIPADPGPCADGCAAPG
jgi:predicted DCC family thiol-disulfide oxidoreductase YuxK